MSKSRVGRDFYISVRCLSAACELYPLHVRNLSSIHFIHSTARANGRYLPARGWATYRRKLELELLKLRRLRGVSPLASMDALPRPLTIASSGCFVARARAASWSPAARPSSEVRPDDNAAGIVVPKLDAITSLTGRVINPDEPSRIV